MDISVGDKAPDFTLPDQNGDEHSLSDYKGKWVLIYFYPRDNTPGCTKEACGIRDNFPKFNKLNIQVLGISKDSVASHKKFADKFELPFTLLADEEKDALQKYGSWKLKKLLGKEYMGIQRMSFLVDPEGKIAKVYKTVKPPKHAQQVLDDLQTLS